MSGVLVYDSNNSGGGWWLSEEDWLALEREGWTVHWGDRTPGYSEDPEELLRPVERRGRTFLGTPATSCAKRGKYENVLIAEWEAITGQSAEARGCDCCGPPHSFYWFEES